MKLSKRTQYLAYGGGVALMCVGTLAAVPLSSSPQSNLRLRLAAQAVTSDFGPLLTNQAVPPNVTSALLVPKASRLLARINYDGSSGSFDRSVELQLPMRSSEVSTFFIQALKKEGWTILENQSASNVRQIIARIGGSDGNYWEVGLKMPFHLGSAQQGLTTTIAHASTQGSTVELRLLRLGEPS